MLEKRCVFLGQYHRWDDRNDKRYLEKYKSEKGLKTLLVCCFSGKRETFHHWKVFASKGVCIEFRKNKLISSLEGVKGVHHKKVRYHHVEYGQAEGGWSVRQLPFLKRRVYVDEAEYRFIYENKTSQESVKELPLDLNCIKKINLSPWLPDAEVQKAIKKIHGIKGCENLNVLPSTVLENSDWVKLLDSLRA